MVWGPLTQATEEENMETQDYYGSAEGYTLNQGEVWIVFLNHSQTREDFQQFLDETGAETSYRAQTVLEWLGY